MDIIVQRIHDATGELEASMLNNNQNEREEKAKSSLKQLFQQLKGLQAHHVTKISPVTVQRIVFYCVMGCDVLKDQSTIYLLSDVVGCLSKKMITVMNYGSIPSLLLGATQKPIKTRSIVFVLQRLEYMRNFGNSLSPLSTEIIKFIISAGGRNDSMVQSALEKYAPNILAELTITPMHAQALCDMAMAESDKSGFGVRATADILGAVLPFHPNKHVILEEALKRAKTQFLSGENIRFLRILKAAWPLCSGAEEHCQVHREVLLLTLMVVSTSKSEQAFTSFSLLKTILTYFPRHLVDFNPSGCFLNNEGHEFLGRNDVGLGGENSQAQNPAEELIIDPLMNAELYEEQQAQVQVRPKFVQVEFPTHSALHNGEEKFLPYCAAFMAKEFLLSGDVEDALATRAGASIQALSLGCVTAIARHCDLNNVRILFGDKVQPLTDVLEFVTHAKDEVLSVEATKLMCALTLYEDEESERCKTASIVNELIGGGTTNQVLKRALLDGLVEHCVQKIPHMTFLPDLLRMVEVEATKSDRKLGNSCAMFLAETKFNAMDPIGKPPSQRSRRCVQMAIRSFVKLVNNNQHVQLFALRLLPQFIYNVSEASNRTETILLGSPDPALQATMSHFLNEYYHWSLTHSPETMLNFGMVLDSITQVCPLAVYQHTYSCFLGLLLEQMENEKLNKAQLIGNLGVIGRSATEGRDRKVSTFEGLVTANAADNFILYPMLVLNLYYSALLAQGDINEFLAQKRKAPPDERSRMMFHATLSGTPIVQFVNSFGRSSAYFTNTTVENLNSDVAGSCQNFLYSMSTESDENCADLLKAAVKCTCKCLEVMSTATTLRIFEELLLYVTVCFELEPSSAIRLLHQLSKSILNRNLPTKDVCGISKLLARKVSYYHTIKDYAIAFTLEDLLSSEYWNNEAQRLTGLGWLRNRLVASSTISTTPKVAAKLQNQIKNTLRLYVQASVKQKNQVVMYVCELLGAGFKLKLIDPHSQLISDLDLARPAGAISPMCLKNAALFDVVLSRSEQADAERLSLRIATLMNQLDNVNGTEAIRAITILILNEVDNGCSVNRYANNFYTCRENAFEFAPSESFLLWFFILVHSDSKSGHSSLLLKSWSSWIQTANDVEDVFFVAMMAFSQIPESAFIPMDELFSDLNNLLGQEMKRAKLLKLTGPILCTIIAKSTTEALCLRMEHLTPEPLSWLTNYLIQLLLSPLESLDPIDEQFMSAYPLFLKCLSRIIEQKPAEDPLLATLALDEGRMDELKAVLQLQCRESRTIDTCLAIIFRPRDRKAVVEVNKASDEAGPNDLENHSSVEGDGAVVNFCTDILSEHCLLDYHFDFIARMPFSDFVQFGNALTRMDFPYQQNFWSRLVLHICDKLNAMDPSATSIQHVDDKQIAAMTQQYQETKLHFTKLISFGLDFARTSEKHFYTLFVTAELHNLAPSHQMELPINIDDVRHVLHYVENSKSYDLRSIEGACYILSHPQNRNDMLMQPLMLLKEHMDALRMLVTRMKKATTPFVAPDLFESQANEYNVVVKGQKKEVLTQYKLTCGDISYAYYLAQISMQSLNDDVFESSVVRKLVTSLLRHPVLYGLSIIPLRATSRQWTVTVDIRSENNVVVVPVSVSHLSNPDIIADYQMRLAWLGWNKRQQFEETWMGLFGVLSSTPCGDESSKIPPIDYAERITCSRAALHILSDLLLKSLTWPLVGAPNSKFIIKHREMPTAYCSTKKFAVLCEIKSQLLGPSYKTCFRQNFENNGLTSDEYQLGQLSALSIWSICGTISSESANTDQTYSPVQKIRTSLSSFLLTTTSDLDTSSSIRMLMEIFVHWCSAGVNTMPTSLMSTVVSSMAYLSDLFDDENTYRFMYKQMQIIYSGEFLSSLPEVGLVIYSLLKSITIIGIENTDEGLSLSEKQKMLMKWIGVGFSHPLLSVHRATASGLLFLMQSISLDLLHPVVHYSAKQIYRSVCNYLSDGDPYKFIRYDSYWRHMWAVGFRILEEPISAFYKSDLFGLIEQFLRDPLRNDKELAVIASGVEGLICTSTVYSVKFLPIAHSCLKNYNEYQQRFLCDLRIAAACVMRGISDQKDSDFTYFHPIVVELLTILRKCDPGHSEYLRIVLPPLLRSTYSADVACSLLLEHMQELCSVSMGHWNRHPSFFALYDYICILRKEKEPTLAQCISKIRQTCRTWKGQRGDLTTAYYCVMQATIDDRFTKFKLGTLVKSGLSKRADVFRDDIDRLVDSTSNF